MITIIFGKPRAGKTALMTHFLTQTMFDPDRTADMAGAVSELNAGGFSYSTPNHTVSANYDVRGEQFGYHPRVSKRINPFRLGYQDTTCKVQGGTHFLPPFSVIGITEGQKYFNSRRSQKYPDWQSRFMEQHGHNDYDIFIDVQRPGLIDVNIRELSSFIEILDKTDLNRNGWVSGVTWRVRTFESSHDLERYFVSGRKDKTTYAETKITAGYNVYECYDHQMCRPKFYQGHLNDDYELLDPEPVLKTYDGYARYLRGLEDELPAGFYDAGAESNEKKPKRGIVA